MGGASEAVNIVKCLLLETTTVVVEAGYIVRITGVPPPRKCARHQWLTRLCNFWMAEKPINLK